MNGKLLQQILFLVVALFLAAGCAKKATDSNSSSSTAAASTPTPTPAPDLGYVYVASGTTYAGNGVTMSSPINAVGRYHITENGPVWDKYIRDYTLNPSDSPVGIVDYDNNNIAVAIENASGRRIETVRKDGTGYNALVVNSTALSGVIRQMIADSYGNILVSKTTAIEKFNMSNGIRIPGPGGAASPYINTPAGTCATVTMIWDMTIGPSDNVFFINVAASPNNKIGIITKNGYNATTDCLAAIAGPTTNHLASSILYHKSSGKLLVAYANSTGSIHQIYSYDVTANTITNPVVAFSDMGIVQGPSRMIEMPDGSVLLAVMSQSFNTIEKFTVKSDGTMTRVGSTAFIAPSVAVRSVSGIAYSSN